MALSNLEKLYICKIFKLQAPINIQNDRTYGVNLSEIREKEHSEKNKFPVSVIVSAGVSKPGKTPFTLLPQIQR